jgi:hypothetical protein
MRRSLVARGVGAAAIVGWWKVFTPWQRNGAPQRLPSTAPISPVQHHETSTSTRWKCATGASSSTPHASSPPYCRRDIHRDQPREPQPGFAGTQCLTRRRRCSRCAGYERPHVESSASTTLTAKNTAPDIAAGPGAHFAHQFPPPPSRTAGEVWRLTPAGRCPMNAAMQHTAARVRDDALVVVTTTPIARHAGGKPGIASPVGRGSVRNGRSAISTGGQADGCADYQCAACRVE